jgi:hypothetical protein
MNHTTAIGDTAKASLPIGGGVALQYLHVADEIATFMAHGVGAISAIIGFWWLIYRIQRDLKNKNSKAE